jgi:parvulin-like peptidyl-prolyl isomerase
MTSNFSNCILYCSREFPDREILSSLYLYFDKIIVVPPAQTIFATHYLGNDFSIDLGLDQASELSRIAENFNEYSADYKANKIIQDYDFDRTKLLNQITLEAWQQISSLKKNSSSINDIYSLRDSIVSSIFSQANRDLIIKDINSTIIENSNPEIEYALQFTMNELPAVITDDLALLKEIKNEIKDSIDSYKNFIRNERFKFLNIIGNRRLINNSLKEEFNVHLKYEIEKLKSAFNTKIGDIKNEKGEIKFGLYGAVIKGIAIGLVSNPALGAISGLFDAYNFGQKWITLKNKEENEINKTKKSEIGLFLKFSEIEKRNLD